MELFYSAKRIATTVDRQQRTSFFRQGVTPLASLQAQRSSLSAVDSGASVIKSESRRISYTPYGLAYDVMEPAIAFKGEYLDVTTGCYPLGNGYRFYCPRLMRFKSPDSESPFGLGGLNAYAFAQGDPVNGSDPTGHFNWTKIFAKLGKSYGGKGQVIDGINIFHSPDPDRPTESVLNILTHGQPGILLGDELGYTPNRLKTLLQENNISYKGQKTQIMACYSAAKPPSGGPSFIEEWSGITGAATTGYLKGAPVIRSVDGENHHAVVLPVLPGYKQLLNLSSKPVTVSAAETNSAIRK